VRCDALTYLLSSFCCGVVVVVQVKFFVDQNGAPIRRFSTPVSEFKEAEKFLVEMLNQRDALYNGTMTPIIPPSASTLSQE